MKTTFFQRLLCSFFQRVNRFVLWHKLPTWLALAAILAIGVTLRCIPWHGFQWVGFDENLYKAYVEKVDALGVGAYPEIAQEYVARQRATEKAFLPPTRFLYIFCAATWRKFCST